MKKQTLTRSVPVGVCVSRLVCCGDVLVFCQKRAKRFEKNFLSVGPGRMIAVTFSLKQGLEIHEENGYTDFR